MPLLKNLMQMSAPHIRKVYSQNHNPLHRIVYARFKEEGTTIRCNNVPFYKHILEEELFNSVFRFTTADDKA